MSLTNIRARKLEVIEATGLKGVGTEENPHRQVTAYFTLDGEFLAERDPWKEEQEDKERAAARARAAA